MTTFHLPLAIAATTLLALAGCAPAAAPSDPAEPAAEPSNASSASTECIADREWVLDLQDLASQLADTLATAGAPVIASTGEGRQTIEFTQTGEVSSSIDATFIVTIDGDGLEISIVQTHAGTPGGEWAWIDDSSVIAIDGWDNSSTQVLSQILINGTEADAPYDLPRDELGDGEMKVECSGSSLVTQAVSSPFVYRWTTTD